MLLYPNLGLTRYFFWLCSINLEPSLPSPLSLDDAFRGLCPNQDIQFAKNCSNFDIKMDLWIESLKNRTPPSSLLVFRSGQLLAPFWTSRSRADSLLEFVQSHGASAMEKSNSGRIESIQDRPAIFWRILLQPSHGNPEPCLVRPLFSGSSSPQPAAVHRRVLPTEDVWPESSSAPMVNGEGPMLWGLLASDEFCRICHPCKAQVSLLPLSVLVNVVFIEFDGCCPQCNWWIYHVNGNSSPCMRACSNHYTGFWVYLEDL